MDTAYSAAATSAEREAAGKETFAITYVKPEKPKAAEEKKTE